MRSIQEMRYETAMAVIHSDPVGCYERAIKRHRSAIKRLKKLIEKLKSERD